MNIFFKGLVFFGVTQVIMASGSTSEVSEHTIQAATGIAPVFSQHDLAMQQMRQCLSDKEQENRQLREQVQWHVNALERWKQWAGGAEGYRYYIDGKYASLERAFFTLQQKCTSLEHSYALLKEKNSTLEVFHTVYRPSLAGIWTAGVGSLTSGIEGVMQRSTLDPNESESSLGLNFDWAATQEEPKES